MKKLSIFLVLGLFVFAAGAFAQSGGKQRIYGPQGNLDNKVIELLRVVTRQRGHLRSGFDLKHPDRIGFLKNAVNLILLRQLREIDFVAIVHRYQFQAIFEHCHHAQAEVTGAGPAGNPRS